MRRASGGAAWLVAGLLAVLAGCETTTTGIVDHDDRFGPAAPRALDAYYYARAVYVTWELAPGWDDESFRVYAKRSTDANYFRIAEVTNCTGGFCSYTDTNILAGQTYQYYVAATDARGRETASDYAVEVAIPQPVAPPVPGAVEAIALDGANYIRWNDAGRGASDFSHYRVYLRSSEETYFLGETDSEGFLDELAENGLTYRYFVTSVDTHGHESSGSAESAATPRPDYHSEWIWDYFDRPGLAGFRFQSDEGLDPVVDGDSSRRHFRLETDADGWWLVPGPGTRIYPQAFETTALKCGPGSDAGCVSLDVAPTSGYSTGDVALAPQLTYVMQVRGDDDQIHYGSIRVTLLGFDQTDDAIMIFDWSYQLQPGNPDLAPVPAAVRSGEGPVK